MTTLHNAKHASSARHSSSVYQHMWCAKHPMKLLFTLVAVIVLAFLCLCSYIAYAVYSQELDYSWYLNHETDTEFTIATPGQLYALTYLVNGCASPNNDNQTYPAVSFKGKTISIKNDIALALPGATPKNFLPIGSSAHPFEGVFKGNNHKITGYSFAYQDADTHNASASDSTSSTSSASSTSSVSSTSDTLAADNDVDTKAFKAHYDSVKNQWNNIGLFGYISKDAYITNLTVQGSLQININDAKLSNVGGVVGCALGKLENITSDVSVHVVNNSKASNAVPTTMTNIAGVCGFSNNTLVACKNTGNITVESSGDCIQDTTSYVLHPLLKGLGGVVGSYGTSPDESHKRILSTSIKQCTNTGVLACKFTGHAPKDRFGETVDAKPACVGGIAGYCSASIIDCKNSGNILTSISGTNNYGYDATEGNGAMQCGGIVGNFGAIIEGSGPLSTEMKDDGGRKDARIQLQRCVNVGQVIASNQVGGIAGTAGTYTTITECNNGNDLENNNALTGEFKNPRKSAIVSTRWNKPFTAGIVGTTLGNVNLCFNRAQVNTIGIGYYVCGIVGSLGSDNQDNIEYIAKEDPTYQPEMWGCYNTGQIGADHATSYRYGALAGENNGYIHHCVVRENCVLGAEAKPSKGSVEDESKEGPSSVFVGGETIGATSELHAVPLEKLHSSECVAILNGNIRNYYKSNDISSNIYWNIDENSNDKLPVLTCNKRPTNLINIKDINVKLADSNLTCPISSTTFVSIPVLNLFDEQGNRLYQNADFIVVPQCTMSNFKTGDSIPFIIKGIGKYTGEVSHENYKYTLGKKSLSAYNAIVKSHTFNWEVNFPRTSDISLINGFGEQLPSSMYSFVIYNSTAQHVSNGDAASRYICFDSKGFIKFTDGKKETVPALDAKTQGRSFNVYDRNNRKISDSKGYVYDSLTGEKASDKVIHYTDKYSGASLTFAVGYSCRFTSYPDPYCIQFIGEAGAEGSTYGTYDIKKVDLVNNPDVNYQSILYTNPDKTVSQWKIYRKLDTEKPHMTTDPISIDFTGSEIKPTISMQYLGHELSIRHTAFANNGYVDPDKSTAGHITVTYGVLKTGTPYPDMDKYANRNVDEGGMLTVSNGGSDSSYGAAYEENACIQFKNYLSLPFKINPAPLTRCEITPVNRLYTGKSMDNLIEVRLHGNVLIKDLDYSVTYIDKNNVKHDKIIDVGEYTAVVAPLKNLAGEPIKCKVKVLTKSKEFKAEQSRYPLKSYEEINPLRYIRVYDTQTMDNLLYGKDYDYIIYEQLYGETEKRPLRSGDTNAKSIHPLTLLSNGKFYIKFIGKGNYDQHVEEMPLDIAPITLQRMDPNSITYENIHCYWNDYEVPYVKFSCDKIFYDGKCIYDGKRYHDFVEILGASAVNYTDNKEFDKYCKHLVEPDKNNQVHGFYLNSSYTDYMYVPLKNPISIEPLPLTKGHFTALLDDIKLNNITYNNGAQDAITMRRNPKSKFIPFYDFQKGRDYDVTYSDNINAGQCSYTVNFKGKFTGTYNGTFTIKPKKLDSSFTVKQDNGALSVTGPWNNPLKEGKDYQIANKSDTFVVIQGIGNYTGDLKANVSIPDVTPGGDTPGGGSTPGGDTPGGDTPGGGSTPGGGGAGGEAPGGGGGSVPSPQDPTDPSGFVPFEEATKRLAGETAADTMQTIVQTAFPNPVPYAVLATNAGYWDALSANALAGSYNAPVLLADQLALPQQTIDELVRLQVQKVFICGGENAISQDVADQLASMGIQTERIAGQWASDTANDIAEKIVNPDNTCFITTSWGYADALSVSSYAYAHRSPILLANYNTATLDDSTLELIKRKGFVHVVVVGGTSVVSADVEQQLAQAGIADVQRIAGYTQYDTSSLLANHFLSCGLSANNFAIATGWGYEDALCGAALCGKNQSILLLADDSDFSTIDTVIADHINEIKRCYLLGGKSVVGENVVSRLKENFIRLSISYSR